MKSQDVRHAYELLDGAALHGLPFWWERKCQKHGEQDLMTLVKLKFQYCGGLTTSIKLLTCRCAMDKRQRMNLIIGRQRVALACWMVRMGAKMAQVSEN